jgi:hypothetical protein
MMIPNNNWRAIYETKACCRHFRSCRNTGACSRATGRCPFRKMSSGLDSRRKAEPSHHLDRCLRLFKRSGCSSPTCLSRGGGLKPRTFHREMTLGGQKRFLTQSRVNHVISRLRLLALVRRAIAWAVASSLACSLDQPIHFTLSQILLLPISRVWLALRQSSVLCHWSCVSHWR